jgi:hypothetical protein
LSAPTKGERGEPLWAIAAWKRPADIGLVRAVEREV